MNDLYFLQEFPLSAKGGGVSIYKRLLNYSDSHGILPFIIYDSNAYKPEINNTQIEHISIKSYNRNIRFGIGRILGSSTSLGIDFRIIKSLNKLFVNKTDYYIHITAHGVSFTSFCMWAILNKRKYIVSVHDLWPLTIKQYLPSKIANAIFKHVAERAEKVFVISEGMKNYFESTIQLKNIEVIHDGFAINDAQNSLPNKTNFEKISILYVGLIHSMQLKIMNEFINKLSLISSHQFEFHICSNANIDTNTNVNIINYGWVNEELISEIAKKCSFGFLPLSFEKQDELFYKTSLMTKIPFYLKLHLPILCIGKSNSSAFRVINEDSIGLCLNNFEKLNEALNDFIKMIENNKFHTHISKSMNDRFNIDVIQKRFYSNFNKTVINA